MKNFEELSWEERKMIVNTAKAAFISKLNNESIKPIETELKRITGIKNIKLDMEIKSSRNGEYIELTSNELIKYAGIMGCALNSIRLETFNTNVVFDEKNQEVYWWGSIDFRYELADGGSNGMKVLSFELRDNKYTFRKVK